MVMVWVCLAGFHCSLVSVVAAKDKCWMQYS